MRFMARAARSRWAAARIVRSAATKERDMTNPLLAEWDTPFNLAPFEAISDEDFAPAFEAAMQEARAEVAAIAESHDAPTFANTIEALDASGKSLDKVLSVFCPRHGEE